MGHVYPWLVLLTVFAIGTLTMTTVCLPLDTTHSDEKGQFRRLESTGPMSFKAEDEERNPLPSQVTESIAKDVETSFKPLMTRIQEFSKDESPFLKSKKLDEYVAHEHATLLNDKIKRPLAFIARTIASHFGEVKLVRWIEEAKQVPEQKALAEQLEAGLFMRWSSSTMNTEDVFKSLKLNFVFENEVKDTTPDKLFKNSGLDTLIGYASKLYEAKKDAIDMAKIASAERKYEKEGQKDVVAVLQSHFNMEDLLYMMEQTIKRPDPLMSVIKIEAGLIDHYLSVENLTVEQLFQILKLEKDKNLATHPLMSVVVMFAAKQSREFDLIKLWDGPISHKTDKLQEILDEAKKNVYSKVWAKEVEKWLTDYLEQKKTLRFLSRPTHYNKPSSSPNEATPKASLLHADSKPISPKEAQTNSESFKVGSRSASTPLPAPLPDAKHKQVITFSDNLKPLTEFETTHNAALPTLPREPFKRTKRQPQMSNKAVTPTADARPISSSPDELSPASTSLHALHQDAKKPKTTLDDDRNPLAEPEPTPNSVLSPQRHNLASDTREQPLTPSEAAISPADRKSIASSPDELSPVSTSLHALHQDAKKPKTTLDNDRNPLAEPEPTPDSVLSPQRHNLPSDTREQPLTPSEAAVPPADRKSIASSPDELSPVSTSLHALHQDAKKPKTTLDNDRNPLAEPEPTPDSVLSPQRHNLPSDTREQPLTPSEAAISPADRKSIASSPDELSPVSTSLHALHQDAKKPKMTLDNDRNPLAEPEPTPDSVLSPQRHNLPSDTREQPLTPSEAAVPPADRKSIASSPDELSPASTSLHALHQDAKKPKTTLDDDRNPLAESEPTPNSVPSPQRHKLPSNTREQPRMPKKDETPSANPKPTPPSSNASHSHSRLARFRRWLSAMLAKVRALLRPST